MSDRELVGWFDNPTACSISSRCRRKWAWYRSLPLFIVHREIERDALTPILNQYQCPQLTTYAIYPQTHHPSKRVRVFVDFFVERFKECHTGIYVYRKQD